MKDLFDFDSPVDRIGTWSTQWDFIEDRFGKKNLIPFSISDMDFKTAPCIIEALQNRISHGVFGYTRWKNDDFLSAISYWFSSEHHCNIDENQIVYGPSVIYIAAKMFQIWSNSGDGIIVHTPNYDGFNKIILANERKLVACPLQKNGNNWSLDRKLFEQLVQNPNNKILLLCNPHNPTGKVWQKDELEFMADLCEKNGIKVISDEIHMDFVWQNQKHIPWNKLAKKNWAIVTSGAKSFNISSLSGSFALIENEDDREKYLSLLKNQDSLSSPCVLFLTAHISAYLHGKDWFYSLKNYLWQNLLFVANELNNAFPILNWAPPESTYLAWIDLRSLKIDDHILQNDLIEYENIAIMPGTTYGEKEGKGFIRLNVACSKSKLEKGLSGLIRAIKKQIN